MSSVTTPEMSELLTSGQTAPAKRTATTPPAAIAARPTPRAIQHARVERYTATAYSANAGSSCADGAMLGDRTTVGSIATAKTGSGCERRSSSASEPSTTSATASTVCATGISAADDTKTGSDVRSATTATTASVMRGCRAQKRRNTPGGRGRDSPSSGPEPAPTTGVRTREDIRPTLQFRAYASRPRSVTQPRTSRPAAHEPSASSAGTMRSDAGAVRSAAAGIGR